MNSLARTFALAVAIAACGGNAATETCVIPPCAPSTALTFTITSASPAVPLAGGVFVNVLGANQTPSGCLQGATTTCGVHGDAGTYQLEIGAPGFQTVKQTVNVAARPEVKCGCGGPETVHLDIALTPAMTAISYEHS